MKARHSCAQKNVKLMLIIASLLNNTLPLNTKVPSVYLWPTEKEYATLPMPAVFSLEPWASKHIWFLIQEIKSP